MVVEICNYHHTIHIAKSGFNSIKRTEVEKERNPLSPAYLCSAALQHSNPRERMRERESEEDQEETYANLFTFFYLDVEKQNTNQIPGTPIIKWCTGAVSRAAAASEGGWHSMAEQGGEFVIWGSLWDLLKTPI